MPLASIFVAWSFSTIEPTRCADFAFFVAARASWIRVIASGVVCEWAADAEVAGGGLLVVEELAELDGGVLAAAVLAELELEPHAASETPMAAAVASREILVTEYMGTRYGTATQGEVVVAKPRPAVAVR